MECGDRPNIREIGILEREKREFGRSKYKDIEAKNFLKLIKNNSDSRKAMKFKQKEFKKPDLCIFYSHC